VPQALAKRNTRELREVRRRVKERIWNGWGLVLDGADRFSIDVRGCTAMPRLTDAGLDTFVGQAS
jgi:hypothetical protein